MDTPTHRGFCPVRKPQVPANLSTAVTSLGHCQLSASRITVNKVILLTVPPVMNHAPHGNHARHGGQGGAGGHTPS